MQICLFKESALLFPQLNLIDTRDWTQIKNSTLTATIFGVSGNLVTLIQAISMGITEIVVSNISTQEHKSSTSGIFVNIIAIEDNLLGGTGVKFSEGSRGRGAGGSDVELELTLEKQRRGARGNEEALQSRGVRMFGLLVVLIFVSTCNSVFTGLGSFSKATHRALVVLLLVSTGNSVFTGLESF